MVEVRVSYVGLIQRLVGRREETLEVTARATLADLLDVLIARFGPGLGERLVEGGELAPLTTVLIDGRNARRLGGLGAGLGDGVDTHVEIVVLAAPFAGG